VQAVITRGAPYFPVPDPAAIDTYYRDVLGFRCEYAAGNEFSIWSRGAATIMFRRVAEPSRIMPNESQGGTWDVFCWVNDVGALHDELAARGATIVYPPTVMPYGMKEFAVRDPNGYVLGFGQPWTAEGAG
jgi:catechol 2,3-dioxygenase-like lactoylglutathione lyase family enzyme